MSDEEQGLAAVRVLVVDDNENMRTILWTLLKGLGIRDVRTVGDGGEALALLTAWWADLIIADLRMAPVDGVSFTRRLRAGENGVPDDLPVIMLTGHSDAKHVEAARDAGVDEFLVKPLSARALVERLNSIIHRRREFIYSPHYVGPCRRRATAADFPGPFRRASDGTGASGRAWTPPRGRSG